MATVAGGVIQKQILKETKVRYLMGVITWPKSLGGIRFSSSRKVKLEIASESLCQHSRDQLGGSCPSELSCIELKYPGLYLYLFIGLWASRGALK